MAFEKVFGKGLRAFQLRGGFRRAKYFQAIFAEDINDAFDQRGFRADDGQIDLIAFGKIE